MRTAATGIKDVAAGRGIQQRMAKAIAAAAVRMFICLVVPGGGGDVTAFISLSANCLPVKEKGRNRPRFARGN